MRAYHEHEAFQLATIIIITVLASGVDTYVGTFVRRHAVVQRLQPPQTQGR